ncbi:Fe3+ ABC transporter, permease protein [[Synechococcus] sp. NIES-970]|uniref:iron ABC transporter permease n=1 Tax=Picosynechococcus sp. NKBG15041c TaxID=1407650 RepID=UPI0004299149|nr:iron ABC transporter permease [Picosynechococcus sp. NKBG15041c]BAW95800.1 Fe3+ ABC transporter, permease protein [[Synechococcus] sp. NIES-970]
MKIPYSTTPLTFLPWPTVRWRSPSLLLVLGLVWGGLFFLNLGLGSTTIPWDQLLAIALGRPVDNPVWANIVWQLRLPRAIAATFAGAALSISGLQMQTLFNNPLAGPFVLGINSGASLGVAIVLLGTGFMGGVLGTLSVAMAASLGAVAVFLLILAIARRVPHNSTLLILGLMLGYVSNALVTLLLHFSPAEALRLYLSWTFGSFAAIHREQLPIFITLILAGGLLAFFQAKPLNALLLGKQYAESVGLNLRATRRQIIASTALLAGSVTAFCGPISFIGIAVPHLCRGLLKTVDHRLLVPAVTLLGASLALLADIIVQLPGSELTLPLNAVTAMFGAPIIIILILRRHS